MLDIAGGHLFTYKTCTHTLPGQQKQAVRFSVVRIDILFKGFAKERKIFHIPPLHLCVGDEAFKEAEHVCGPRETRTL